MIVDHAMLEHVLRVVDRLSGPSRVWVRGDRVLDEIAGARLGSLTGALAHVPWWDDPRTTPLVALVELVRRELVSGQGDFGAGSAPPAEPSLLRVRRAKRPLHLLLVELDAIPDPGGRVLQG
ncbi:MAG: hypothetical protein ACTHU0_26780 [Kofleriaceae bacterium]